MSLLVLILASGCEEGDVIYSIDDDMKVVVYGFVYDGLGSSLSGTEAPDVYYSYNGTRKAASYSSSLNTYSFEIPDNVESLIITASLTGYHDFSAVMQVDDLSPIVPDSASGIMAIEHVSGLESQDRNLKLKLSLRMFHI